MSVFSLRPRADKALHWLAGAYVLDALPADEERAFERHLETCEVCRLEVEELGETVARLGLAAAAAPPAGMRTEVLGRAAAQRQRSPRSATRPSLGRPRSRVLAPLAAAAAASAVTFALADLREPAGLGRDPAVSAVLAAEDVRTVQIDAPGSVRASVHHSPLDGRAVLVVDDLDPLPGGQVYEVWSYRDGTPQPVGYLTQDGDGTAAVALPPAVEDGDSVAVTVEPEGGSQAPTGRVVARGDLTED